MGGALRGVALGAVLCVACLSLMGEARSVARRRAFDPPHRQHQAQPQQQPKAPPSHHAKKEGKRGSKLSPQVGSFSALEGDFERVGRTADALPSTGSSLEATAVGLRKGARSLFADGAQPEPEYAQRLEREVKSMSSQIKGLLHQVKELQDAEVAKESARAPAMTTGAAPHDKVPQQAPTANHGREDSEAFEINHADALEQDEERDLEEEHDLEEERSKPKQKQPSKGARHSSKKRPQQVESEDEGIMSQVAQAASSAEEMLSGGVRTLEGLVVGDEEEDDGHAQKDRRLGGDNEESD